MNNESKTLRCEIVEDLLPLYHDGVVNVITAEAVEEHLKECEVCKKEYESLSSSFSAKAEKTTKEAFTIMIKKKRLRQVLLTALACMLSCALLSGLWSFLNHACVVVQKDIKVESAYSFTDPDGQMKIYVDYYCPPARSISHEYREDGGKTVCEATLRAPFILPNMEDYDWNDAIIIRIEGTEPVEELIFGGVTVWRKDVNKDEEIPAYVYAMDIFENYSNNDEFGDSDTCSLSRGENTITLEHAKYGRLTWNEEGKLIDGSPEKEKEIIEMYN